MSVNHLFKEPEDWDKNADYCKECGNRYENCICERCNSCNKYFALYKLYKFNNLILCEKCIGKKGIKNFKNYG